MSRSRQSSRLQTSWPGGIGRISLDLNSIILGQNCLRGFATEIDLFSALPRESYGWMGKVLNPTRNNSDVFWFFGRQRTVIRFKESRDALQRRVCYCGDLHCHIAFRMGDSILGGFHLHLENPKAAVPSTVDSQCAKASSWFFLDIHETLHLFWTSQPFCIPSKMCVFDCFGMFFIPYTVMDSGIWGNDSSAWVCSAHERALLEQGTSCCDGEIFTARWGDNRKPMSGACDSHNTHRANGTNEEIWKSRWKYEIKFENTNININIWHDMYWYVLV